MASLGILSVAKIGILYLTIYRDREKINFLEKGLDYERKTAIIHSAVSLNQAVEYMQ